MTQGSSLKVGVQGERLLLTHDTGLLVFPDLLFEKVSFTLKGDQVHEIEGVFRIEVFRTTEGDEQAISHEFNVLTHQFTVHSNEGDREGLSQEFLFDSDGLSDDAGDGLNGGASVL